MGNNYISAESKKLMPESKALSRRRNDSGSEFCSPNVMVPDTKGDVEYDTHERYSEEQFGERERANRGRVLRRLNQGRD